MLADLAGRDRPDAVLSFAPPRHVYGALATLLMPARLGRPAWYRPQYFGHMPAPAGRRWTIVAVPWTYSILLRQRAWIEQVSHISVLHSTAMLPPTAERLLRRLGPDKMSLTEIFGSTETGGIAWRTRERDDPPWNLFADVEYAKTTEDGREAPLVVRSPRLAIGASGARLDLWETGDYVTPDGDRRFRFSGRRERLVKVNGRRVNLDVVESDFRSVLPCADLACLPMSHDVSGEHIELLIVPGPDGVRGEDDVRGRLAAAQGQLQPRQITFVPSIDRSDSGKPRQRQPGSPHSLEVTE
ncbi:acyl--CoA ligase [Spiractinospora alimapuensis]|uniref:class I adenylate-forming enzyme family protein n=1 Tax=Spiractinospora alimapuensis TaxID=2820884 RepID=UPI001F2391B0|nr:class I adenylate-forming enzyme family protein [Spiractinospora alimapuensis]QVQ51823.1 acyl--CoA ligase [Spiractinospora alimapuensis]